jgi:tRNA A37 threonylcarbamoyladenosine modification protein TsaB
MVSQLDQKLTTLASATASNTEKLATLVTLTSEQNSLIAEEIQQQKEVLLGLVTTIENLKLNAASPENLAGIDEQIIAAQQMANRQTQIIEMVRNNNAAIATIIPDEQPV